MFLVDLSGNLNRRACIFLSILLLKSHLKCCKIKVYNYTHNVTTIESQLMRLIKEQEVGSIDTPFRSCPTFAPNKRTCMKKCTMHALTFPKLALLLKWIYWLKFNSRTPAQHERSWNKKSSKKKVTTNCIRYSISPRIKEHHFSL